MAYYNTISWHVTGLAGVLTFAAYDASNNVKIAASTAYLTERPAGSGEYVISVPTLNAVSGDYGIVSDGQAGLGHSVTFPLLEPTLAGGGGTVNEETEINIEETNIA